MIGYHSKRFPSHEDDDIVCAYGNIGEYTFLNTKTEGMLQLTFEMLIEHGHIKWQGSLRSTYNKYLHPDVLNHDTKAYYDALNSGGLLSAFQFDSGAGVKAIRAIHPTSLLETANANSLMRLMSDGESEQPMDMYVRYKADLTEWLHDMEAYGLNPKEIDIIREHLDKDYGVCSSQEGMMLLVMDKRIAGFDVKEANTLRKAVAKKKPKLLQEAHDLLFKKGKAIGCREEFLHYIWDVQIAMQRGYSFSILHTTGYSWILLQQLELITKYPKIYWETAVLQVESGAIEQAKDEDDDDDDSDSKEKTTNYEAIGSAIATLQKQGVNIAVPDINIAGTGFLPNEETNSIIYGLKSIAGINNTTADFIISHRPYTSLDDFYERLCLVKREVPQKKDPTKFQMKALVGNKQMMNLLQAGAFDSLHPDKEREDIIVDYLRLINKPLAKLTVKHIDDLIERNLIPEEYEESLKYYDFRAYVKSGNTKYQDETTKSKVWYLLDGEDEADTEYVVNAFFDMFPELDEGVHWKYDDQYNSGGIWIATGGSAKKSFEGVCNAHIAPLTRYMNSDDCLHSYNESRLEDVKREVMCDSRAEGEMASCCCYFGEHELGRINNQVYGVKNFFELSEEPEVESYWTKRDKETGTEMQIPKFRIDRICGTVLGRNKTKHVVTVLTEFGVVNVKFYSGQFSFYDRQLSTSYIGADGKSKNKTIQKSLFSRGNLVFIHGIRRGDEFVAKTYKNGLYSHSVYLIDQVYDDGFVTYDEERPIILD